MITFSPANRRIVPASPASGATGGGLVASPPVLFLVFNRPDTTARVFEAIRRARPERLYVAADGPRPDRVGEDEKVREVRGIVDRVDWPCEVRTLFREENLGCKRAVSEAISWFFEAEPEGIVLEDDCLPEPSFFRFCGELLARYRDDERVAMISGDNFQFGRQRTDASYYFSRYLHIWGWASWRRAWKHYDVGATAWPTMRDDGWLASLTSSADEARFWSKAFQAVYDGSLDTWDYQWVLAAWSQNMLAAMPETNLISNIGFGSEATHTRGQNAYAEMSTAPMTFPLRHPEIVLPNPQADAFTARGMFTSSIPRRIVRKLCRLLS